MNTTRIRAGRILAAGAGAAVLAASGTAAAATPTTLVPVAAAPAAAETSIGLVPANWSYLGYQGPATLYGPPSANHDNGDFVRKIVTDVHARVTPDGPHPLTVAGYKASYSRGKDGVQSVDLVYSKSVDIDIQLWSNAHTTRRQALRIAGTIDIRSVKIKSHG